MTTSPGTRERAQEAASTAADEGRHVAGVAKEEAANVASETAQQARSLVNDTVTQVSQQVSEQSRAQRDSLVTTLQTLGDDLERMADNGGGSMAAQLAREVAQRTRTIGSHLDGREPVELLDDARRFARERPGTFLLGALAAGVVAGRLVRGARDGIAGAAAAPQTPQATGFTGAAYPPVGGTTNPPMPSVTPGHQTMDPAGTGPSYTGGTGAPVTPPAPSFADPTPTSTFDADGPMGTDAAGYGERGTFGEAPR